VKQATAAIQRSERSLSKAASGTSERALSAAADLTRATAQLRTELAVSESRQSALNSALLPAMAAVRQNLLHMDPNDNPLDLVSPPLDLNAFLDAVLPLEPTSSPDLVQSHNAIEILARQAGGLAHDQLIIWRARLADPLALAEWLNHQQGVFHGLLKWMYATRNMAFHNGKFTVPADELTAQAARRVIDMVLEFLGNWHKVERSAGLPESEPVGVLEELSQRRDYLDSQLRSARSCHALNITTISAPGSDCWNRV
jgi:hypothetical protein